MGRELIWEGSGVEEKGIEKKSGRVIVAVDPRYFRPTEVDILVGDATKAYQKMGWKTKIGLEELVSIMMKHDLEETK